MILTKRQVSKLNKIMGIVQDMLNKAEGAAKQAKKAGGRNVSIRRRRSGTDAAKMRTDVLKQRAKGVPASVLAEKYDVSTAYIYMIKK